MTQKKINHTGVNYLLKTIKQELHKVAIPELAAPMSAYLKNHFPFLGIKSPFRRQATGYLIKESKSLSFQELELLLNCLWEENEREFQYVALDILGKYKPKPEDAFIELVEKLILQKSWWDSVDMLAGNISCRYFLKYPEILVKTITKWNNSENMWLNRSAILNQLKAKDKTNFHLLEKVILSHSHSNEFFIQKAIGWSLREFARTKPDLVKEFVQKNSLKPLSKREAMKHLH